MHSQPSMDFVDKFQCLLVSEEILDIDISWSGHIIFFVECAHLTEVVTTRFSML